MFKSFICISTLLLSSTAVASDMHSHHHAHHHNAHAHGSHPVGLGIMGDHIHKTGEWMVTMTTSEMNMNGLRRGTNGADIGAAHQAHMVAPLSMTMNMQMLGVMYGLTDDTTLTFMGSHITQEMDHQMRNGNRFRRQSSGLGDVKIGALHRLHQGDNTLLTGGLALSLPVGSINQTDDAGNHLPFPMQLGSGTYDVLPQLTYTQQFNDFALGAKAAATVRLGQNDHGYRLGHSYKATIFGGKKLSTKWGATANVSYSYRENAQGQDSLMPAATMVPTADPNQQARSDIALTLGAQYQTADKGELALEAGLPLYQNVKGYQLERDWQLALRWRLKF